MKIRILENVENLTFFFPKVFDEISGDINKYYFLVLYNKICQNFEDLHSSVDQYAPNDYVTKSLMLKDPFRGQETPTM